MAIVVAPLPKAGSASFKEVWERSQRLLDLPRLIVLIEGALDRGTMELEVQRVTRVGRVQGFSRGELVGQLANGYLANPDAAYGLASKLDKACHKERHIVASMEEDTVVDRLQAYKALDFRRERARLIWALIRDGRQGHWLAAEQILAEAFKAIDSDTRAAQALEQPAQMTTEVMADLKRRMMQYETAIEATSAQLRSEASQREAFERERSELIARVATREHARKEAELERRKLEDDRRVLTDRVAALEAEQKSLSPQRVAQLEADGRRHLDRADALERALAHAADATRVQQLQQQLDAAHSAHHIEVEQLQQSLFALQATTADEHAALQHRLDQARAELKAARQQLAGTATRSVDGEARVALLLDDANLSLSARRSFSGRLDYRALVAVVLGHRRRGPVVAFVVSSEDAQRHTGFVRSLRDAGIDVREKRARARADGSRKADWDMGIAMEALDRLDDYDVLVLGSGDGDFLPLLQRLKAHGKRVEVASFAASSEEQLLRFVDAVHELDERVELRGER